MDLPKFGVAGGILTIVSLLAAAGTTPAMAQIPGITGATAPKAKSPESPKPAPTPESPKATVASSSGKISVREAVTDRELQETLRSLLHRYPGVRDVHVKVEKGFVTLDGQVEDDDVHDQISEFVRRVEGVRLVLNLMVTDDDVMTAPQLAHREWEGVRLFFARKWLLILVAIGLVAGSFLLARLFNHYSETLLAPFVKNTLLRSVLGSLLGAAIVLGGTLGALSTLKLTQAVLSVLGLAGVVGLAVGFAFKDITENFIASMLLGVRRPFRAGDFVQVAGQAGVVYSLNTRATVLVTPEGKHVRIPNATVYKEILINSSASASTLGSFDVLIPYEASTSDAIDAMTAALASQDGVLSDPPPRALIAALESGGVRLRATFWAPVKGIDGDKLASDAKLKVKTALQQKGIQLTLAPWGLPATASGSRPVPAVASGRIEPPSPVGKAQSTASATVHANIRRDAEAAANSEPVSDGRMCALTPGVLEAGSRVGEEGVNLLKENGATTATKPVG